MLPSSRPLPRQLPDLRSRFAELREEPRLSRERVDALVAAIDEQFDECARACWVLAAHEGFPDRDGDTLPLERQLHALSVLRSRALALYASAA
jgi:hypothetical protein